MSDLRDMLIEYKNASVGINVCLDIEDYDNLNTLLDKREGIIQCIKTLNYDRNEFREICSELQITIIEENLRNLMNVKSHELKDKMARVSVGRSVNAGYYKKPLVDSMILNKKI